MFPFIMWVDLILKPKLKERLTRTTRRLLCSKQALNLSVCISSPGPAALPCRYVIVRLHNSNGGFIFFWQLKNLLQQVAGREQEARKQQQTETAVKERLLLEVRKHTQS